MKPQEDEGRFPCLCSPLEPVACLSQMPLQNCHKRYCREGPRTGASDRDAPFVLLNLPMDRHHLDLDGGGS